MSNPTGDALVNFAAQNHTPITIDQVLKAKVLAKLDSACRQWASEKRTGSG